MTARSSLLLALVLLPATTARPASTQDFELTVATIMRGPELVGTEPSSVRWTEDGRWIYFQWKPGGRPWHEEPESYRVPARGGSPEIVSDAHMDSVGPLLASGDVSADRRWKVVSHDGDIWLIERRTGSMTRLTATGSAERSPVFSPDARTIYFVQGDDLFAVDRGTGGIRQLTEVRKGPADPDDPEPEGLAGYLEAQQRELLEHVRREAEERERRETEREAREAAERQPVRIDAKERVFGMVVAPTERWALLHVGREAEEERQTIVPDYVTESGYTRPLEARSKVGDRQSSARIGLVDVQKGGVAWLDLSPDVRIDPADSAGRPAGEHPDLAMADLVGWNDDGSMALVSAVSFDFRHRWLHLVDAGTGEVRTIAHDYDRAWIGGPCSFCAGWMPDGRSVWFVSERDGWAHLYTVRAEGGEPRQLTSGQWEVHEVALSPDRRRFWLTTNEGSPHEYHFYHMPVSGGERTRITGPAGFHDVTPSPDGDRLADVHSYSNRPPELYVLQNRPGAAMTRITDSPTAEWKSFGWVAPEIVRFRARDGTMVPSRIYRPTDLGAQANGAGIIFVHGAGYLQNVHRGWSSYYREYMFHHLLAARGYTVLDIDYRGSEGYGRDWRTAIYRHMGGKDLSDQVDGAAYLAAAEGVDAERIGIYGGSYGGFITLMALFTRADHFAAGAALRSVTDWAHYNHWYTARILNQPQDDDEAYRRSSPIYFAEGLEDPLLIAHGMVDTNVHFQDVVRLAQRLIELGKTDWEMAVYPVEGHAFIEPASWADEYRRILELFEENLGALDPR
ncbi:MAG: prolyl oligopeptidase family serine peptidase [Gemmatimonadetes bacterium]|nr:prolyl oligopeptidase family serine peptidase [Gemmatimonadota bacterium]